MPETAAEANAKMPKDQEGGGEQQTGRDEVLGRQDGKGAKAFDPISCLAGEEFGQGT